MIRRALLAFSLLLLLVFVAVERWASLSSFSPLSPAERDAVMRRVRDRADATRLDRPLPHRGPVVATLWDAGEPIARVSGFGETLGAAASDAGRALAAVTLDPARRARARLKVDVVLARAPLVTWPRLLVAVGVVPGVDGVGLAIGDRETLVLADDLLRDDLAAAYAPLPGMEFTIGLDANAVVRRLLVEANAPRGAARRWFRFRADSFVEPADPASRASTPSLPVTRGNTPGPPVTKENLRQAAIAGGRYLLRHLRDDGRFDYEYWTARDQVSLGGYSIPRHAGATWYLAQLHLRTHDPTFLDGAERAARWLMTAAPPGCTGQERACIGEPDADTVDLGSSALALVALAELERARPDPARAAFTDRLIRFVEEMQKPDGDFRHLYHSSTGKKDDHTKLLYYSGEAAFALARLLGLPRFSQRDDLSQSLDRALHYLTDTQYRPFALRFYFMEDHWTCMAVEAGWDHLPPAHRERYAQFCDAFVAFLGRTQFHAGDAVVDEQPDFAGAYGFSPLLPPHGTPVGSRSETTLSTLILQEKRKLPATVIEKTRRQLMDGMQFLLAHQIHGDAAWLMADPGKADGGFLMSDVARYVRIDFVQHACSAMLRVAETL